MKQKNEWQVVCEKCGWEGTAEKLNLKNCEDHCPKCYSTQIEWKGEEDGFEALYKELAYLEKQRNEQHQKEIVALNNRLKFKESQANDLKEKMVGLIKRISKQDELIVSLEAAVDQDQQTKEVMRQDLYTLISVFHDQLNEGDKQYFRKYLS